MIRLEISGLTGEVRPNKRMKLTMPYRFKGMR